MPAVAAPPAAAPSSSSSSSAAPAADKSTTPTSTAPPPDKTTPEPGTDAEYEAELDALDEAKPEGQQKVTKETKDAKAGERQDDKAKETDKGVQAPTGDKGDKKPPKAADLRSAYEELKKKHEAIEPEVARLRSENEEFKKNGGADIKTWKDRAEAAEKRNGELEREMQFVDYSKSKEYTDKFVEPLKKEWARTAADLKEIIIEVDDGQGGVTQREATTDDVVRLANMPLGEARRTAKALFGDTADDIMAHVRELRRLSDAQHEALSQARDASQKRAEQLKADQSARSQQAETWWKEKNQQLAQKYPKWFAPDPEDPEFSELLKKGFAMADRLFTPTAETAPKTLEEKVRLDAQVRNRAAAALPLAHKLKKAHARIAELEKELADYQRSEPGAGGDRARAGGPPGDWREEAEREIDAMDDKSLGR